MPKVRFPPIADMASFCANHRMVSGRTLWTQSALVLTAGLVSCATPGSGDQAEFSSVTVAELKENPKNWHNKNVEVAGVASARPQVNRLYNSIYELCLPDSPIHIDFDYTAPDLPIVYDRTGIFRGRFIANNNKGDLDKVGPGYVPGRLENTRLVSWFRGYINACF